MTTTRTGWLAATAGATLLTLGAAAAAPEEAPKEERKPTVHRVVIKAMKYEPEVVEVRAGDEIVWVNEDIVPHTVTASDRSVDSGLLEPKQTSSWVPDEVGEHPYICIYHPTMTGKVIVK